MATITGTAADDTLVGPDDETNTILGLGGNDLLIGGNYQDPLLFHQGEGGDIIRGGDGKDTLYGLGGNDTLHGEAGNDSLYGGDGDDLLRGGAGADYFAGGTGRDRISFFHLDATAAVVVSLLDGIVWNDGYGNVETFVEIEDLGQGTVFGDKFVGNHSDNFFLTDTGDDVWGFDGNDVFQLWGAAHYLDGGNGVDTIDRFASSTLVADMTGDGLADIITTTTGVDVDLSRHLIVNDGFGHSGAVYNVENVGGSSYADTIRGDAVANMLWGHEGNDKLIGAGGDDVLIGGLGRDTLSGGAGGDRFVYEDAAESTVAAGGRDSISGFEHLIDKIDLTGLADEVVGGGPLSFAVGGFTGVAGQVTISATSATAFTVAADLNGDLIADFMIGVSGAPGFGYADIVI